MRTPLNRAFCLAAISVLFLNAPTRAADPATEPGLVAEYFNDGSDFKAGARPFLVRVDPDVNHQETNSNFAKSKLSENFTARWTGAIRAEKAGPYTFFTASDDGSRLSIDGMVVVDHWGMHSNSEKSGTADLAAGDHAIKIEYQQGGGGAAMIASWQPPGGQKQPIPKSVLFHSKGSANIAWDEAAWKKIKANGGPGKTDANSPWGRMDYGPFLSHTINADYPSDNDTLKGIAVKLDHGKAGYLFDTQLLRPSAAWTGDFLVLKGVAFNGDHGPHPEVAGEIAFGTRNTPGWAKPGTTDFTDPRPEKLGPLPHDWLRYRGRYRYGDHVVFGYTVGTTRVLELPRSATLDGKAVFLRTLEVGPSTVPLTCLVAEEDGVKEPVHDGSVSESPTATVANDARTVNAAVIGAPDGSRWGIETGKLGRLTLTIAPHDRPVLLTVACAGGSDTEPLDAKRIAAYAARKDIEVDLDSMTKAGPKLEEIGIETKGILGDADGKSKDAAYVVDTLTVPDKNPYNAWIRFGGFDFFPDGKSAAVCTWSGDVWIVSGIDDTLQHLKWRRYASGLFQALGLKIVNGDVYVHGRDQITRLHDLNGDGEADFYECFNNDVAVTSGFHEFAFDLQTDPQGNFYFVKAGPVMPGGGGFQRIGPNNGTMMKVSPDGEHLSVVATGFRAPNGMGVGPHGEITCGDNEGTWTPECRLNWIKQDGFYGVVDLAHRQTPPTSTDNPLCWFPKSWDNSSGGQVWVTSEKWGPFAGDLLHLSYGTCKLFKVLKEELGGQVQGGVVAFPLNFDSGIMRARFNPADGQLYVCGLRGWQTSAAKDACLQRVRFTGKPVAMPKELHVKPNGIELTFTDDLDPETANDVSSYAAERWSYRWTNGYGSGEYKVSDPNASGHDTLTVKSAKLGTDKRTVFLEIAEGIVPCMQMQVNYNVETKTGQELKSQVMMTVNTIGDGKRLVISTDKPSGEVK